MIKGLFSYRNLDNPRLFESDDNDRSYEIPYSSNFTMLMTDVIQYTFPQMDYSSSVLKVEVGDEEVLKNFLSINYPNSIDDLDVFLSDLLNSMLRELLAKGSFGMEIVKDDANNYYLRKVAKDKTFIFLGMFWQVIFNMKKFNLILNRNVFSLSIPKSLGGRKDWLKIKKALLNQEGLAPKFYLDDLKTVNLDNTFDWKEYSYPDKFCPISF
jgi:hypothetical protein